VWHHGLYGTFIYRLDSLLKGDEHHAHAPLWGMTPCTFCNAFTLLEEVHFWEKPGQLNKKQQQQQRSSDPVLHSAAGWANNNCGWANKNCALFNILY